MYHIAFLSISVCWYESLSGPQCDKMDLNLM